MMEEAAATRRAALDAIADVGPAELQDLLQDRLESASMVPGVMTILSARASSDGTTPIAVDGSLPESLACRAAGVQLIYDGLERTRTLAHEEPWAHRDESKGRSDDGQEAVAEEDTATDPDLAILVADVLVARGFHLLARTPASDQAVRTVKAFGRDQTVRRSTGDARLDANLEADVLELAVVAGATFGDAGTAPVLREFATTLATSDGECIGFPDPTDFFPANVGDRLQTVVADGAHSDGVRTSVDD